MQNLAKTFKSEFHRLRNIIFVVFVFFMAAAFTFASTSNMRSSHAANAYDFRAGNIISDAVMGNYHAMSLSEIQAFLSSKNSCDNRNYDEYLEMTNRWPHIQWHWEGEPYNGHFVCLSQERFGNTPSEIGSGQTAAEIIYEAAQANRINPQVLLVLLQKETSLITDKIPNSLDYSKATGYGCPDTAACDTKYSGFKNQVNRAAELFRYTLDYGSTTYPEGRNVYVGYNPASSCGGSQIFIENRATASLYRYTPYQPNSAALAAGYGYGDGCSAYGNRNFFLYFTDWFGSTQAAVKGDQITIPDGEYSLTLSTNSDLALAAKGGNVAMAQLNAGDQAQRWAIHKDATSGYYQLISVSTGQPLITQNAQVSDGTKVIYGNSATCSKNWKIYRTQDNYLALESACASGMVLSANGTVSAGVNMSIVNDLEGQKWQLHVGRTLDDGIYNLRTMLDTDKDLEIYGDYEYNGANVSIWDHIDRENRKWEITYDPATDSYTFVNLISGKALDLFGGTPTNGANVSIYEQNHSCAQRWQLVPQANGSYNVLTTCAPGYGLDVYGANKKNGANVSIWSTNDHSSQQWQITPVAQAIPDGTYNLRTRLNPNKDLEVYGDYEYNGANVSIWDHIDRDNRKWQITYDAATDEYVIINQNSEKALDLSGALPQNGQNIQIWQPNSSCSQRWSISATNNDYYMIRSACDRHQVLDVYENRSANGTNVTSFKDHGSTNQQWRFVAVEDE